MLSSFSCVCWPSVCVLWRNVCYVFCQLKKKFFNVYLFLRDRERQSTCRGGAEIGRHRSWSRFQALSCQHRAWCRAQTHQLWDHDLSWSRKLNQLSHLGAPDHFLIGLSVFWVLICIISSLYILDTNPFSFVDCFLHWAAFYFDVVPIIYFCFYFSCLRRHI